MKNILHKILVFILLGLITLFLVLIGYWLLYPYTPLSIVQPLEVSPKTYKVGDRLGLIIDYCSYIAVPVTTNVRFVRKGDTDQLDTVIAASPTRTSVSKVGCNKITSNSYQILDDFKPGRYTLEITAVYQVNPLRQIPVQITSEMFEVK